MKLIVFGILIMFGVVAKADVPAVHGMLLFGEKTIYESHLPMFHHPHDYQLIIDLSLKNIPRSQTLEVYEHFKNDGETFFTLVPEKMDLSLVISGEKNTFRALVYLGHFERGGRNLGPVSVTVNSILYSKKLDAIESQESEDKYFVFGKDGEYFATHVIKSRPSFDLVLNVTAPSKFPQKHCRSRFCPEPIPTVIEDHELPLILIEEAVAVPGRGDRIGQSSASVEVKKVIYFEEEELRH